VAQYSALSRKAHVVRKLSKNHLMRGAARPWCQQTDGHLEFLVGEQPMPPKGFRLSLMTQARYMDP
jgi:hypothetical protein